MGDPSERELLVPPMYERCRALQAAGRGRSEDAERWATEAIARARATESRWDELEALRARGVAALLARGPTAALESFQPVWEHTTRERVDKPGVFPVAPDMVEALAELGASDEAGREPSVAKTRRGAGSPVGLGDRGALRGAARLVRERVQRRRGNEAGARGRGVPGTRAAIRSGSVPAQSRPLPAATQAMACGSRVARVAS